MFTRARARSTRFLRAEDGGVLYFGLMMLLMMFGLAGMAVDLMRYESQRVRLQTTVDRAVLAAASLTQDAEAEEVVASYFAAAGLTSYLGDTEVDEGLNFRDVRATASSVMPTYFMRFLGIDELAPRVSSRAEERITDVEISLVLDVSGSMGWMAGSSGRTRISMLHEAGRDFVEILIPANAADNPISISVVPYHSQVNAGADLLSRFPLRLFGQPYSHCVDFQPLDYLTTALGPLSVLQGAGHGSTEWNWPAQPFRYLCPIPPGNADPRQIRVYRGDRASLVNQITALQAEGNTSIDIAMRWGVGLLDPGMRPIISAMVSEGLVPAQFNGRPFNYNVPQTMKVVVLMSDGENTSEAIINPLFRAGLSNIWINDAAYNDDNSLSVLVESGVRAGQYWHRRDNTYHPAPWPYTTTQNCVSQQVCTRWRSNGTCREWQTQQVCTPVHTTTARRLTWPELFHRVAIYWYAWDLVATAEGLTGNARNNRANSIYNGIVSWQNAEKDNRLRDICAAARAQGIIIFTVAFHAPERGRNALRNCASSPAHYLEVSDTSQINITTAFRAIARQIMQLRLTE